MIMNINARASDGGSGPRLYHIWIVWHTSYMFQSHIVSGLIKCSQFTYLFECIIINRVAILSFNTHHEASEDSQIQICGEFQTFHFDVCVNVEYPRSFCILWIKRKQWSDYHCEYCFVFWCLLWVVVNLAQSNEILYFTLGYSKLIPRSR